MVSFPYRSEAQMQLFLHLETQKVDINKNKILNVLHNLMNDITS